MHCRTAFARDEDWALIEEYVLPVSYGFDASANESLSKHLHTCRQKVDQAATQIDQEIADLRKDLETPPAKPVMRRNVSRWHWAKVQFLVKQVHKYRKIVAEDKLKIVEHRKQVITAMQRFIEFLIQNPHPVVIKINRVVAPVSFPFAYNKTVMMKINRLKRIVDSEITQMTIFPAPFKSNEANKRFVLEAVDLGVAAKKPGTSYFYELPIEESLRVFLKSRKSPLCVKTKDIEPIWPFRGGSECVCEWIREATQVMVKWAGIEGEDKEGAVGVFLVRFLFYETHPRLYIDSDLDFELAHKMERFAAKTPEEIGIQEKYVVEGCKGKPVSQMFTMDSISSAPVEWFRNAVHQVCPLDAAYAIVKVHESLTVMAVLRDTARREKAQVQDFCDKMPGFDDIFEIWLSLIATVGSLNPEGLLNFINTYSKLPGFTARINVSLTYLEGTLMQFRSED